MSSTMTVLCPCCKKPHQQDVSDGLLRVAVDIGWFTSGGGCPETFGLDGLCEDCADELFNELANVLRDRAGLPALTLEDERERMEAES